MEGSFTSYVCATARKDTFPALSDHGSVSENGRAHYLFMGKMVISHDTTKQKQGFVNVPWQDFEHH